MESRPPDFIVGGADFPYLLRWWLIPRNRFFNIYLHRFLRSDDDRALHDHPWVSASILIDGGYREHLEGGTVRDCGPGRVVFRRPSTAHRVELVDQLCTTVFITGPKVREWGFHCPHGWRHWREFSAPHDKGLVGKGCE